MHDIRSEKGVENAPFFPDRIITGLVRFCGAISTALVLVVLIQITFAVTRRYLMGRPLQWNDEMVGYLLVTMVMLGAAEALRRGDHIAIDLATARLGPRMGRIQSVFASFTIMVFAVIVGMSTWDSISFARAFGSYSVGYIEIQTWIPQVPVVIGSMLLFLAAGLRLLRSIREVPK